MYLGFEFLIEIAEDFAGTTNSSAWTAVSFFTGGGFRIRPTITPKIIPNINSCIVFSATRVFKKHVV
jgi:hypothetical protein